MQYPGYETGKVKLTEGNEYTFDVFNCIELQDNELYYVLVDVNGLKHFLPEKPYRHYGLRIGEMAVCRIDRINCTGRIFLEPRHPVYEEGQEYAFKISTREKDADEKQLFVTDVFGNSVAVALPGNSFITQQAQKSIVCRVKKVTKGIPELEIAGPA